MEINYSLFYWFVAWLFVVALVIYWQWNSKLTGSGLVVAHLGNMWMTHWVGAAVYIFPWYIGITAPDYVLAGFKQSLYATIAFSVGSVVVAPVVIRWLGFPKSGAQLQTSSSVASAYIAVGLITNFILAPYLGWLPSMAALTSCGWQLTVIGVILKVWDSWRRKRFNAMYKWVLAGIAFPFITIITAGFIGYGTVMLMLILAFVSVFYRPRWKLVVAGFFLVYLLLSVYVTYMRDRGEIRASVWGGEAYSQRLDKLYNTATTPELFDPNDQAHLWRIDARLNQSALIGAAVIYMEAGNKEYAYGSTLFEALIALIPRALWWDKPTKAGSGNMVADYTGMTFAQGTSVGIGQVMEFYINFGTLGVIGGFFLIGIIITLIDRAAFVRLAEGNWKSFAFWFLPGLGLLQVGGSMVEVTATTGAGMVVVYLVNRYVIPKLGLKPLALLRQRYQYRPLPTISSKLQ